MQRPHILVVGAGSVGKRHLTNFSRLGCRVSAIDPRQDRLTEAGQLVSLDKKGFSLDSVLTPEHDFGGVVIASPPCFHVEQTVLAMQNSLPVLLEKPVSASLAEAIQLESVRQINDGKILMGYTYRWWQPLQEFRRRIHSGEIGTPFHVNFTMSAHLADWHPWEDYRDFFMASKELGGGALLDESHFLDLMLWIFGRPSSLFACVDKLSRLEITTDDNVDIIARYKTSGLLAKIHLDLYGRPHEKHITVVGDAGTLQWSFNPNQIRFADTPDLMWTDSVFEGERNDMFLGIAREFLAVLNGQTDLTCSLSEGIETMKLVELCRESSRLGRMIDLAN